MRINFILTLLILACSTLGFSQTLTKNKKGEQIIVYPDGSWRYFNQEPPGEAPAAKQTPPEEEQYAKTELNAEAEARARTILRKQIQQELKTLNKLVKVARKQEKEEQKEEDKIAELRSNTGAQDREQLSIANRKLQEARKNTQIANIKVDEKRKSIEVLEQGLVMTRRARKDYFKDVGIIDDVPPIVVNNPTAEVNKKKTKEERQDPMKVEAERIRKQVTEARKSQNKEYLTYNIESDPRYNPPASKCEFEYNGVDEFTQKQRINLAPSLFFGFTTPELKPYLGSESLINCHGKLIRSGGYLLLELEYVIRSKYANKEFGVLPKGSNLSIKFIDNGKLTLRNQTLTQGKFDPVEKVFSYTARYPINSKQEKILRNSLVDQVRVMWGTGFDDYPIYEIDFFQRQLECLN